MSKKLQALWHSNIANGGETQSPQIGSKHVQGRHFIIGNDVFLIPIYISQIAFPFSANWAVSTNKALHLSQTIQAEIKCGNRRDFVRRLNTLEFSFFVFKFFFFCLVLSFLEIDFQHLEIFL